MSNIRPYSQPALGARRTEQRVTSALETIALMVVGGLAAVLLGAFALGAIALLLWPLGHSLGFTFPLAALLVFGGFGAGVALCDGRDALDHLSR